MLHEGAARKVLMLFSASRITALSKAVWRNPGSMRGAAKGFFDASLTDPREVGVRRMTLAVRKFPDGGVLAGKPF